MCHPHSLTCHPSWCTTPAPCTSWWRRSTLTFWAESLVSYLSPAIPVVRTGSFDYLLPINDARTIAQRQFVHAPVLKKHKHNETPTLKKGFPDLSLFALNCGLLQPETDLNSDGKLFGAWRILKVELGIFQQGISVIHQERERERERERKNRRHFLIVVFTRHECCEIEFSA